MSDGTPLIRLEDVAKQFYRKGQAVLACRDINLSIRRGEFVSIVGPSGCGKSTMLNMISGLMKPSHGTIYYAGESVQNLNRKTGYVTQRDNLLPWKNVEGNVGIALEVTHVDRETRQRKIAEQIKLVGLGGFEKHYPAELSGGMRKRVGLARTLIYEPETMLMDEPFGALDAQLKLILHDELLKLWDRERKTIVFVTHDLTEAVTLSDRVVVFSSRPGRIKLIQEIDLPRPRNVFKDRFTERFGELHEKLWASLEDDIQQGEDV